MIPRLRVIAIDGAFYIRRLSDGVLVGGPYATARAAHAACALVPA